MNSARSIGLIAPLLLAGCSNYGHLGGANPGTWSRPIRMYSPQRYANAANKSVCKKRRAKNKAARKSQRRNRQP